MIERSFDANFLNSVLNHPEVYPWVCGTLGAPFDYTPFLQDHRNYMFRASHGAFLAMFQGDGRYEVHTQFLPEGRGTAFDAAIESIDYMFSNTDCTELTTMVPVGNAAAKRLAEKAGFHYVRTEGEWLMHGKFVPLEHFSLAKGGN